MNKTVKVRNEIQILQLIQTNLNQMFASGNGLAKCLISSLCSTNTEQQPVIISQIREHPIRAQPQILTITDISISIDVDIDTEV